MRAVALTVSMLCASVALAQKSKPRKYVMRELRFDGPVAPAQQQLLQERVWSAVEFVLSMRGSELVHMEDRIAANIEHPRTKGCFEPRCHLELAEALSATRVLVITISRSGPPGDKGDWSARVENFATDAVRVAGATDIRCAACTGEQLISKINHELEPVLNADKPAALCTLEVASTQGMTVTVDGLAVGEAPFSHSVAAGPHRVTVEKPGVPGKSVQIDCPEGRTVTASLTPDEAAPVAPPSPPVAEAPRRLPLLKIVGGALVGLGAAGVIGGAVALAFDGKGSCDLAAGQAECPQLYDSTGVGAALVGAGAAALVGGVVLLVVDSVRGRSSSLALDVGPLRSGAFASLKGQF